MKRLNVKHRVVIGLLGLVVSFVMLAFFLGIEDFSLFGGGFFLNFPLIL